MRQLLRALGVVGFAAVAIAVTTVVRRWSAERAPRRDLNGSGPVIGSFDTWPTVPRAAAKGTEPVAGTVAGTLTEP